MKIQKKTIWLIFGMINMLVILFSAFVIWNSEQAEVGAAFLDQSGDERSFRQEYSTSAMKPGVYRGTVKYTASDDSYTLSCNAKGDGGSYPVIYADEYQLKAAEHELTFCMWVNSGIDYLFVVVETENTGAEISMDSIVFKRQFRQTFTYLMLRVGFALFLSDLAAIAVWKRKKLWQWVNGHFYVIAGLAGIFCISSLCLLTDCQTEGHDLQFHLARIAGLAEGLAAGNFPVRIQPGWCNDYGYAVSVFYGDVLLYLPAVLYLLGVPLVYTYKIYVLLVNIGTIGIAYYCYQRLCHDRYIGLLCTALSCLSINRILNVYVRAAVGEYSAYMFLPLVLLGVKEILCTDSEEDSDKSSWVFLGIGMAGVLQTHILSFEMTCIVVGMTVIVLAGRVLRRQRWKEFLKSAVLAICLCAGFIVPFLDYSRQGLEIFKEKYEYGIQGFGLTLYELLSLPTRGVGHALMTDVGFKGRFPVSLGIGVIVMLALTVTALVKLSWDKKERDRLIFVLVLSGVCVWMSTCYFPWNRLAAVPGIRNAVASIQIPWRFLSLGIPLLTYAAGMTLIRVKKEIVRGRMKYLLLCMYMVIAVQGMYCVDLAMRGENMVIYDGTACLGMNYTLMGGEYLFVDTNKSAAQENQQVEGKNVTVKSVERSGNRVTAMCSASSDAYLEIPMFAYSYYRCVDIESGRELPVTTGFNYKIRVDLPADYQGTLTVFFEEPWHWRAAEICSTLTLLLLCIYLAYVTVGKQKRLTESINIVSKQFHKINTTTT